jgi:hypothetical protein
MYAAHLYTPRTSPFRFPRYLCGSECYGMRLDRVKCGSERCAACAGGASMVRACTLGGRVGGWD